MDSSLHFSYHEYGCTFFFCPQCYLCIPLSPYKIMITTIMIANTYGVAYISHVYYRHLIHASQQFCVVGTVTIDQFGYYTCLLGRMKRSITKAVSVRIKQWNLHCWDRILKFIFFLFGRGMVRDWLGLLQRIIGWWYLLCCQRQSKEIWYFWMNVLSLPCGNYTW